VSPFVRSTRLRRRVSLRAPLWTHRLRRLLGSGRTVVDGVHYIHRRPETLPRALGRYGRALHVYEVRFPSGTAMRIRATHRRTYDDLSGPDRITLYQMADELLRPGMRVLDLAAGTGAPAAWIARRTGPSGAVVALERDTESLRFARRRYGADARVPLSFELGHLAALSGETDNSFDAAFAVHAVRTRDDGARVFRELRRVIAPGGWLLATAPPSVPPPTPGANDDALDARTLRPDELRRLIGEPARTDVLSNAVGQPAVVLARFPKTDQRQDRAEPIQPDAWRYPEDDEPDAD
jgi:SAM-dependent methyltransferase